MREKMKKNRAFTLIELLVVMAIMGLLGTISVGGYRAMQRGMEQRGVLLNVRQFVLAAQERARIDRVPVKVYFWNETLKEETDTEPPVIVGKAAAVRRTGRITQVQGEYLYDEFGDLQAMLPETDSDGEVHQTDDKQQGLYLYKMDKGISFERSLIASDTETNKTFTVWVYVQNINDMENAEFRDVTIQPFGFRVVDGSASKWNTGTPYGFAFQEIQLPHNYIFGSSYSESASSPIKTLSVFNYTFDPLKDAYNKSFSDVIQVSNLRPSAGGMKAVSIGNSNASVD